MKAIYERVSTAQERSEKLEDQLTTAEKRTALKDLLGDVHLRGNNLDLQNEEENRTWISQTYVLIEAAFDKGTAQHFLSNQGYRLEGFAPIDNLRLSMDPLWIDARLWRLEELILRIDRERLNIRSDFDLERFTRQMRESPFGKSNLAVALEEARAESEKLKTDYKEVMAEKDEFELKSRELETDRDGQLSERCWELSRELFKFYEEAKRQDPEEAMRQYEQRFKGRVDRVRVHLKRLERWNPREDMREKLENPADPDDILSLADYLNASGAHRFW
jgi:hypothetical protein